MALVPWYVETSDSARRKKKQQQQQTATTTRNHTKTIPIKNATSNVENYARIYTIVYDIE